MQKAADSGYAPAQFSMGLNYLRGAGVSEDPGQAYALFQKAAQSEDADAQYFLAVLSAIGHGKVKDQWEALRWFRLAKSNGFPVPDDLLTPAGVAELGKNKWVGSQTSKRSGMSAGRELVRRIQASLARLGYQIGSVDGIFGKKTETAIKAFQMKKGLAVDGKATQALLK
ncbi:peptidoglycan-binding protein, partial [Thermodesulfobacteriota bacterium]